MSSSPDKNASFEIVIAEVMTGKRVHLKMSKAELSEQTVNDLRSSIGDTFNMKDFRLIYAGYELLDLSKLLSAYGIDGEKKHVVIHLVSRRKLSIPESISKAPKKNKKRKRRSASSSLVSSPDTTTRAIGDRRSECSHSTTPTAASTTNATETDVAVTKTVDAWTCQICTYAHKELKERQFLCCAMCGASKPASGEIASLEFCSVCGDGGRLVLCDKCPRSFHSVCLEISTDGLPEGEWACPRCDGRDHSGRTYEAVPWYEVEIEWAGK